jgi:hypothetical protein
MIWKYGSTIIINKWTILIIVLFHHQIPSCNPFQKSLFLIASPSAGVIISIKSNLIQKYVIIQTLRD